MGKGEWSERSNALHHHLLLQDSDGGGGNASRSQDPCPKFYDKEFLRTMRRFGLPETWIERRPAVLAKRKRLCWSSARFESAGHREKSYRFARQRKPFLFRHLPPWTFMVPNLMLLSWFYVHFFTSELNNSS